MLTPYLPYPPHGGGSMRIMELIRFLQTRHEVTVVSFIHNERDQQSKKVLSKYCEAVIGVPKRIQHLSEYDPRPRQIGEHWTTEMHDTLYALNQMRQFDLVDIEHIWMAQYAPLLDAPAVLHEHNIESQVLKRYAEFSAQKQEPMLYSPRSHFRDAHIQWPKLVEYENFMWPKFPLRITVSDLNYKEMVRRCPTGQVVVIPNGVDCKTFLPVASVDSTNALFVGTFNYQPNLDAAFELCDVIWPLVQQHIPQACLYIIGNFPPPELLSRHQSGSIEIIPNAPSIIPYAALCSVSLVPVRVGSGTRIKILTSMSLGLPVISTMVGCEGLELEHGRDVLIAEKSEQFAQQIIYLLNNKEKRHKMALRGRSKVEAHYDWQDLFSPLESILENL